jgi:hypothetical protein
MVIYFCDLRISTTDTWDIQTLTATGLSSIFSRLVTIYARVTGSITPFWVGQKANIIVTLVEIMITFCIWLNVIRILILVSLLGG